MNILLVIVSLSIVAPTVGAEAVAQSNPPNMQQAPAKRGEAFEKCLVEYSNAELNRIEQSGVKIKREMILLVAKTAFQTCTPSALSETLSLEEVQEIRLRVLGYLDSYWISTRGT